VCDNVTALVPADRAAFGRVLRLGVLGLLVHDSPPYFAHLAGQVLLHMLSPNETAWTILVWAFLEAGQLLAAFPDQYVKPHQLCLKLCFNSLFAIHHDEIESLL
jgi:hypothetical protein